MVPIHDSGIVEATYEPRGTSNIQRRTSNGSANPRSLRRSVFDVFPRFRGSMREIFNSLPGFSRPGHLRNALVSAMRWRIIGRVERKNEPLAGRGADAPRVRADAPARFAAAQF